MLLFEKGESEYTPRAGRSDLPFFTERIKRCNVKGLTWSRGRPRIRAKFYHQDIPSQRLPFLARRVVQDTVSVLARPSPRNLHQGASMVYEHHRHEMKCL